ncbi:hypothetical protein [Alicyclobacillus sp. SO9]|uniref:hypothetical protein n=1 Tax=Alicyclobacillus sp. SO9 TaxID=2665646 RepID=UPI0018E8E3F7|nr:hypothetical protein [Alicyclobacillus sp. SO9]QQE76812.1 hypothetical protein GI364_12380 [Alicyclobacillus sp. SO9]
MASEALKAFRKKMLNPMHWRTVNKTMVQYTKSELQQVDMAGKLMEELAQELNIRLSKEEKREAAKWLVSKQVDPKSKRDRLRIWKYIKGD